MRKLNVDVAGAAYILAVALVGFFVWRTAAGLLVGNDATKSVGKAMLAVSG